MNRQFWIGLLADSTLSAGILATLVAPAVAQSNSSHPQMMPSGQIITPLAPPGAVFSKLNPGLKDFPSYTVGQAVKTVQHDPAGLYRDAFGTKGGETFGDDIGIDELLNAQGAYQEVGRGGCLARSVRTCHDDEVGYWTGHNVHAIAGP